MQIKREDPSDTSVKLTVDVEPEVLIKHHNKVIKKLSRKVKVPGFRSGKAPIDLIEKQLDDNQLQSEVLDSVIQEIASRALVEHKIRSIGQPQVNINKFVPKEILSFVLEVERMPEVKLPNYKSIKKSAPKVAIKQAEIDSVVESLQKRVAEKKEVSRQAKLGDEVVINFAGEDDKGRPIAGGKGSNYPLLLGSKTFIPGFEEGLVGKKAGEDVTVHPKFPKDYNVKALAGITAKFEVKVLKVNEISLPKADDKFAAKVGPFKSIKELTGDIKKELTSQKEYETSNKLKDEIVKEIVEKTKVSLPETLVSEQAEAIRSDFIQNLTARGMTIKEYLEQEKIKSEEEWIEKSVTPEAEKRVKVGIVLSAISEQENVTVSEEEFQSNLAMMKRQYADSGALDQLDTPQARNDIMSRLYTEKTLAILYNLATGK